MFTTRHLLVMAGAAAIFAGANAAYALADTAPSDAVSPAGFAGDWYEVVLDDGSRILVDQAIHDRAEADGNSVLSCGLVDALAGQGANPAATAAIDVTSPTAAGAQSPVDGKDGADGSDGVDGKDGADGVGTAADSDDDTVEASNLVDADGSGTAISPTIDLGDLIDVDADDSVDADASDLTSPVDASDLDLPVDGDLPVDVDGLVDDASGTGAGLLGGLLG